MKHEFAIAPGCWGIEDPNNPDNPPWETVLKEISLSGFTGLELGPYGYLPTDPVILKEQLKEKQLKMIAGTIYDDLTAGGDMKMIVDKTRDICDILSKLSNGKGEHFLVIIDAVKDIRNNTAGHPELAKRLEVSEWKKMMDNIATISRIAYDEFGVRPVVHPHAGGYIEFGDEIEQLVNDLSHDTLGLCLDTGHLYYAKDDPVSSLKKYSSRLDYVHFKDIDPAVYDKALKEQMGFYDACNQGVMCSIGRGCLDYSAILKTLDELEYSRAITIEQERDPKDYAGALDDVKKSFEYLQKAEK